MNVYLKPEAVLRLNFWRKKSLNSEIRTTFNMELYLKVLKAKNS